LQFDRLKITGFKTFVDPVEFHIEQGLTGVVGPNGCGKSNLVEALRWVMGETSHKSLRASAMDDVIFSGASSRPSRNSAEVVLRIDNADFKAPTQFNDADTLEISRRIERDEGSTYRLNGREVRARDVQLLFADAASGARSPSLVRQGQIGEIIAAKPQARRRILEDAAGVAGLHSRRHEAELRLKAAEDNLIRAEDVLKSLGSQMESLRRQAKQASRYKDIAAEIRKMEAMQLHLAWIEAKKNAAIAQSALDAAVQAVALAMTEQGEAARLQAVREHELEPLRESEARAAAVHQRLQIALDQLADEEERQKRRAAELDRRLAELNRDLERERQVAGDAAAARDRLLAEKATLDGQRGKEEALIALLDKQKAADLACAEAEAQLSQLQGRVAEERALRQAGERAVAAARQTLERAERAELQARQQVAALESELTAPAAAIARLKSDAEKAAEAAGHAEAQVLKAEQALRETRDQEQVLRPRLAEAERSFQRLDTEAKTIRKLIDGASTGLWDPIINSITVEPGFEVALAAALGDALEASAEASAPAHWKLLVGTSDAPLPGGADALLGKVKAPQPLHRVLAQIGVVARDQLGALQGQLAPGQMLVSREGDVARWDGFASAANAPSPAARRLAEKNRLGEIEAAGADWAQKRDALRKDIEAAITAVRIATNAETEARTLARDTRRKAEVTRDAALQEERRVATATARLDALRNESLRAAQVLLESQETLKAAEMDLPPQSDPAEAERRLSVERAIVAQARGAAVEARAAFESARREADMLEKRLAAILQDLADWSRREERSGSQMGDLVRRLDEAKQEAETLAAAPDDFVIRRRALQHEISEAGQRRKDAGDARAAGETAFAEADRQARAMLKTLSDARETQIRCEGQIENTQEKRVSVERAIYETLEIAPSAIAQLTGLSENAAPHDLEDAELRLIELKRERERLGAVNLRADEELAEIENTQNKLTGERAELETAIRKLRRGIESLNNEGRGRLTQAFDVVNGHFKRLFTTLFGGGEAELTLIESDDPLEAGLEIIARPPGKKPQVLTLLSGGEQALTATALIFAVFLTNPSPVCVLDEIDAPLDDANVERLCDLLDAMVKETATRFITITHNPITMARMDRLFGVTMVEKGVSQLVSVALAEAAELAESA
jgi:chromosome segregation protein